MIGNFNPALTHVLRFEGGYVDHPKDPGGATNMGITIRTLWRWRGHPVTKADVRAISREEAGRIYKLWYWDAAACDSLLSGVDLCTFDVSVNSGPARAKSWLPLAAGKSAVEGVKALCARRRAFFQSLKTFATFGRGWMRRVNEIESIALGWAAKAQGLSPSAVLKAEAGKSKASAGKAKAGAVVTGSAPGAALHPDVAQQATSLDWVALVVIGLPFAFAAAFLIFKAASHSGRAESLEAQAIEGETQEGGA